MAERLNKLLKNGHIKPHVDQELALDRLAEAHTTVISGNGSRGKIVIVIEDKE